MRQKGGSGDNNASAAFFDAIFVDPEAKESVNNVCVCQIFKN